MGSPEERAGGRAGGPAAGLAVEGVRLRFGSGGGVAGVSLHVAPGEVVALLGPNGAGKSTLFRVIAGLAIPQAGEVRLQGRALQGGLAARARRGLGYLPQEEAHLWDLSVEENTRAALQLAGRPVALSAAILERVGLRDLGARRPATLSGGERRRLALARLLALDAQLLLLDEPFAGVDPISVQRLGALIVGLAREGRAVLFTDHAVRDAFQISDRVLLLEGGEIQAEGTPAQVAASHFARARYLGEDFQLPTPSPPPLPKGEPIR